jgi:hypothetical protein
MRHTGKGLDRGLQQVMTRLALHVRYQAESAVILKLIGTKQTCTHNHSLDISYNNQHITQKRTNRVTDPQNQGRPFYTAEGIVSNF